jgi:DNA polymerase-1
MRVVILTGDRDTLQLVEDDRVVVKTFNKGVSDTTIYDEKAVIEKYSLDDRINLIDYKSLVGDPSDNIKGVPGRWTQNRPRPHQTLSATVKNMFEKMGEDPKLEAKFGNFKKEAELSEELVTLERKVPVAMPQLEDLAPPATDDAIAAYFKLMGFNTLLKRLEGGGVGALADLSAKEPKKAKPKNPQAPLF